VSGMDLKLL